MFSFDRICYSPDDGGSGGGAAAAASADPPAAPAAGSLLGDTAAAMPAGEPGSPAPADPASADPDSGGETPKPAEGAPETYADFSLPEGMAINDAARDQFTVLAKDLNLTQDGAQKLVDLYVAQAAEAAQAPYKLWTETQAHWVKEVEADPEIGGANLAASLATAARALDQFGGQDLRDALNFTGAGNNPVIVKAFVRIGTALSEDRFIPGAPPKSGPKSAAAVLYPNMPEKL